MNLYFNNDTIAAIASAPSSVSAIGIIRVSGANAIASIKDLIVPFNKKIKEKLLDSDRAGIPSHKLYRCSVLNKNKAEIDNGMFVFMKSPNSYTGEDIVEFYLHGSPFILENFLEALVSQKSIRLAEPGEFSFRAFQNGKIDLSQAEAVIDLIHSKNQLAASSALASLKGKVKEGIEPIKEGLLTLLSQVELEIDFADQNVSHLQYEEVAYVIRKLILKLQIAQSHYINFLPLRDGIRTVIVGPPNAGKSTLFNRIVGENRSIVSNIAGTTRDTIRETIRLGEIYLLFSDTAGIRSTNDPLESEGIERSFQEVAEAQVILVLIDALVEGQYSADYLNKIRKLLEERNGHAKILFIINKIDSLSKESLEQVSIELKNRDDHFILLSAKSGEGIENLERSLKNIFSINTIPEETLGISTERQFKNLSVTIDFLEHALKRIENGDEYPDLLALDLRNALNGIAEISGEVTSDDILNHIFSKFCIGK